MNPNDYDTLEEFLAAVEAEARQKWADAGKPGPDVEPQHGGGGGP